MGRAEPQSYNLFLILIGACVLLGFYLVFRLQRDVAEETGTVGEEDRLKELERAYYAGGMSREEFERIKALLTGEPDEPPPAKPRSGVLADRLKELELAYDAGGMSEEEFERVRASLLATPAAPRAPKVDPDGDEPD